MQLVNFKQSAYCKLTAAFIAVACFVAVFIGVAITNQFAMVERASRLEGQHVAELIADAAIENNAVIPQLQEYVMRLNSVRKRDLVIVNVDKKGIADADPDELGQIFQHDRDDEVGKSLRDGRARTFIETNTRHPDGAYQVVVPLRISASDLARPPIGAVILEYTAIRQELYDTERRSMLLIAAVGAVVVVLVTLFGLGVARRLTNPLRDLKNSVDRIAAEEYGTRVIIKSQDEIGVLGLAINKMVEDLSASRTRLVEHKHSLEQRVAERTEALNQSNTLLRQVNADLEQSRNDADAANQAKSSFLATMSHEIRTPMNGVIGMIDVLHQTSLNGYQVEMVELIRDSGLSLLTIIDDILDFSKIEAGRLDIESAPISLAHVVEKACALLDPLAIKKDVELTLFIDPSLPGSVLGDGLRICQVLVNLVGNAIKFSSGRDQPGRVAVRVTMTESGPRQIGVDFQVIDNGIGMDEETQARLFTAFSQADTSTTRRFGGTGLGLVISRHLIELMGGYLSLQSTPEKGSTFSISLQFARLENQVDLAEPARELSGLQCIAIGDAGGLAEDLAVYLAHDGARVERAVDLLAASALMAALPAGLWVWMIDCVDTRMPVEDLRAFGRNLVRQNITFVVIERGARREPHAKAADLVVIDGNVLAHRRLVKAVAIAGGRALQNETMPLPGLHSAAFKKPSHIDALRDGRLILVAEDNETNQKVIMRQLALLGFAADIAGNGVQALQRWHTGHYALLLTDLHMPDMDGYELTAAIRAEEHAKDLAGGPGGRRIPILVWTANALKGEAERCRAAGMDDYLSKPVQLADLKAALETWLPSAASGALALADAAAHAAPDAAAAVDVAVLENVVGSDPADIREFLHKFQIDAAKIVLQLKAACIECEALQARDQAHKLKSSARAVGAMALGELCAAMEAAGEAGNTETLSALLPVFEREFDAVNAFLHGLQATRPDRRQGVTEIHAVDRSLIRILVLDDESFMLKLLAHMLTGLGYRAVTTCDNGPAALDLVDAANRPDLILMDLNMPEMDGIEFVRRLVERQYTGSLILVSGEDERVLQMAEKLVQAHRIPVLGHLNKPVTLDGLALLVNKWKPSTGTPREAKKAYGPTELRAAIDNHELVNFYQPKVAATTGAVVGVETLVRWRHPVDGLVFPDQFIGVAEEHGLIDDLTRVVLNSAMAQAKRWQQAGLRLRVAVNVSMDNLSSVAFADFVASAAVMADVAPEDIVLEITESRLMLDQRAPLEVLTRLRLKRFRLSIDDFGTGNSSLTQLRDIPFDELKIDQSFVHGAWQDSTARAMYDASLRLGKQLGMEVVAEGVEDREDWDLVRSTGCDLVQGYFIARPMPAEDLTSWIESWNVRLLQLPLGMP